MTTRRELTKRETEDGVEVVVSELRSPRALVGDAGRTASLYGGIAGASGLAVMVLYAMTFMPKYGLMRGLRNFYEALTTALPTVAIYGLPMLLALFAVVFAGSVWKRRSLWTSYRITSDGERLRCVRETPLDTSIVLDVAIDDVDEVQASRSSRSDAETIVGDPWELTILTADDMRTIGAGLGGRDAHRARDALEKTIAEAGPDATDDTVLDFDDTGDSTADSATADSGDRDVERAPAVGKQSRRE